MGPQFSFKTYQNVQNTTVLSSQSSALLSQSPEVNLSNMDITSDEVDLESLKWEFHPLNEMIKNCNKIFLDFINANFNIIFFLDFVSFKISDLWVWDF